ncbi:unnamed protein product, partial [Choristocarpus tenellus]
ESITTQKWFYLQPHRSTALQSLPLQESRKRVASPSPGGTWTKSVGKPGHGGRRENWGGRPKGRLGKRAVRLCAIVLRKHLSKNPGVEYLSGRQLQQALAVWNLCESEWLKETRKKVLGLG